MYLVDTNIFLEILLQQDKSEKCKTFLNDNLGLLNISDFSLHSIGVILFRQNQESAFQRFIADTLPNINLINLPKPLYDELIITRQSQNLDFDSRSFSLFTHVPNADPIAVESPAMPIST